MDNAIQLRLIKLLDVRQSSDIRQTFGNRAYGPVGPVGPGAPASPGAPGAPAAPSSPGGPGTPSLPGWPGSPGGPSNPCSKISAARTYSLYGRKRIMIAIAVASKWLSESAILQSNVTADSRNSMSDADSLNGMYGM